MHYLKSLWSLGSREIILFDLFTNLYKLYSSKPPYFSDRVANILSLREQYFKLIYIC